MESKNLPPEACFANFRWEDCGRPPVKVLYYWKPGSRCEVGVWRGCFPNMNMFKNEYECVATCIFTARAESSDYHALKEPDISESATTFENETSVDNLKLSLDEGNTTYAVNQTITGNSSIAGNATKISPDEGNTTYAVNQTITGNSSVAGNATKISSDEGNTTYAVNQTIAGNSSIAGSATKISSDEGNTTYAVNQTITGNSSIAGNATKIN
ncbi:unnamed protein product, partial [Brenthis ino]